MGEEIVIYSEENMPPTNTIIVANYDIDGTIVKKGDVVLCMGEIVNMEGHIVFIHRAKNGENKVYWGYHPENFREATEEDL